MPGAVLNPLNELEQQLFEVDVNPIIQMIKLRHSLTDSVYTNSSEDSSLNWPDSIQTFTVCFHCTKQPAAETPSPALLQGACPARLLGLGGSSVVGGWLHQSWEPFALHRGACRAGCALKGLSGHLKPRIMICFWPGPAGRLVGQAALQIKKPGGQGLLSLTDLAAKWY